MRHAIFIALVGTTLVAGAAAGDSGLLVESYGKLLFVRADGTGRVLSDSTNSAALSPDGQTVAFTTSSQVLSIMSVAGGPTKQIVKLPAGSHFGQIGWMKDGRSLLYEGEGGHLFIILTSQDGSIPRDLGPWYQGFSVSPDGSAVVHAVNSPVSGLEVLDIPTGRRTLIHKTGKVVWNAKFAPDGQWIAYEMTFRDPPRTKNDEPDCTPPSIGLRLYSMRTKADVAVTISAAPRDWNNVKSFDWSPDSKRLALTAGTTDCDYPGSANGVFMTSVDQKAQIRVSAGEMSLEPVFSPDGTALVFVDFSDPPAKLIRYDIATRNRTVFRRGSETDNSYHLLDWK